MITEVAENWRLDRMAAIDRNILRLGAYEMLYCPEVPAKVAINEALELAKRYSTAQSSRFVNGILDRVLQLHDAEASRGRGARPSRPRPSPSVRGRPRPRTAPPEAEPEAGRDRTSVRRSRPTRPDRVRAGADLHVHTTHSDGVCSPCEVVSPRPASGLAALAITDHDTVSALAVARPEADAAGRRADRRGRADLPSTTAARSTCWATSSATTTRPARRDDRPARGRGRAARRRWPSGWTALGLLVDLEALRRAFPRATLGPAAPGRLPGADRPGRRRLARRSPASSATAARPSVPSRGSTGPRRSRLIRGRGRRCRAGPPAL